jgi:hypothetical protein
LHARSINEHRKCVLKPCHHTHNQTGIPAGGQQHTAWHSTDGRPSAAVASTAGDTTVAVPLCSQVRFRGTCSWQMQLCRHSTQLAPHTGLTQRSGCVRPVVSRLLTRVPGLAAAHLRCRLLRRLDLCCLTNSVFISALLLRSFGAPMTWAEWLQAALYPVMSVVQLAVMFWWKESYQQHRFKVSKARTRARAAAADSQHTAE